MGGQAAAYGSRMGIFSPWWFNEQSLSMGGEIAHDNANYLDIGGHDQWDKETAPIGSFGPNGFL